MCFVDHVESLIQKAEEANTRADHLAAHNLELQERCWQQQQQLRELQGILDAHGISVPAQGASASRSSHQDDADGAAEEGELVEGGEEEAPPEEEEEEENEEAPSDPEEKTKKLAPKPSQSPYLSSQAPAFSPSASRSSRPVSPSRRPSKKARK